MNEKIHHIYQKNGDFIKGDLWELVLTEEFVKIQILQEKLYDILQEVRENINEIKSQKKTIQNDISTFEKLQLECFNHLKMINEKLKKMVQS